VTPQRELRYYISIPKLLLALFGSSLFTVGGLWAWRVGANAMMAWLTIVFGGLCALIFLAILVFAAILREPSLAIDPEGITARHPLTPWNAVFVPWSDVRCIGIRTRYGAAASTASEFQVQARDPNRYTLSRLQRFSARVVPTSPGTVIDAPLNLLFFGRKQRAAFLKHVQQSFAPEIIQYHVVVDEAERLV
jgi:hypothetical protein